MYEEYEENQIFIGMPFDESMKNIQKVIEVCCENNNLQPKIVSNSISSHTIIDVIKKLIENSEFIIIDLTMENPNVYYELGYADGAGNEGKDILLIAKKGTDLKFDIRHRTVNFYEDAFDLQEKLKEILPKFIKESRE